MPSATAPSAPAPLTIWIPQTYAESAQPFWAAIAVEQVDSGRAPARPAGEQTVDGRVWVSVHLADLAADGAACELPAEGGGSIPATLRVLPRGAGAGDLLRTNNKKADPANIAAFIIGVLVLVYFLVSR